MSKDKSSGFGGHIRSELHPLSVVPDPCKHTAGTMARVGTAWRHPDSYKQEDTYPLVEGGPEKSAEALDRMSG